MNVVSLVFIGLQTAMGCMQTTKDARKSKRRGRTPRKWKLNCFSDKDLNASRTQEDDEVKNMGWAEEEWRLEDVDADELVYRTIDDENKGKGDTNNDKDEYEDDEQPVIAEFLRRIQKSPSLPGSPTHFAEDANLPGQVYVETRSTTDAIGARTVDMIPAFEESAVVECDAGPVPKGDDDAPSPDNSDDIDRYSPVSASAESMDYIYQCEDEETDTEPVTKIYHYNTEDWNDFYRAIEEEMVEQNGEDLRIVNVTPQALDGTSLESLLKTPTPGNDLDQIIYNGIQQLSRTPSPDIDIHRTINYIENVISPTTDIDKERTVNYIQNIIVDVILTRVAETVAPKKIIEEAEERSSVSSEEFENDRWTPPLVEGEIYGGGGILRRTVHDVNEKKRRNITWHPDAKPPATNWTIKDPISDAFMRIYSQIVAKRTRRERARAKMAELSCRLVNSRSGGMITQGCRIPVAIATDGSRRLASHSATRIIPPGCRIPVPITKNTYCFPALSESPPSFHSMIKKVSRIPIRRMIQMSELGYVNVKKECSRIPRAIDRKQFPVVDNEFTGSVNNDYTRNTREIQQFKGIQVYKQRFKMMKQGHEAWKKGLTPFQIWVIETTGTSDDEVILQPKIRTRRAASKSRISCWRST